MSLIRRQKTDAVAAANRANSHASTGPVTHAGKLQARMNALHHGLRADPARVLPQLGEKDEDLLDLQKQFNYRFRPQDYTETALVEQMVGNRWRRRRVMRAEAGLLVAHQLQFDLDQGRALAAENRSSSSVGEARLAQEEGLASLPDSSQKFRFILQCLGAARRVVEGEGFCEMGLKRLEAVYGPEPGLAGAALLASYRAGQKRAPDPSSPPHDEPRANPTGFLALLDSEISAFQTLQQLHEASRGPLATAMRETLTLLPSDDLNRILRYEEFLDRQYERLLRQFEHFREHRTAI